jgi:hypothetical protein
MTIMMGMTSMAGKRSLTVVFLRQGYSLHSRVRQKVFSTRSEASPLFLSPPEIVNSVEPSPKILFPKDIQVIPVSTADEILSQVEHHYDVEGGQFVGGMGESDSGVWFVPTNDSDPVNHLDDLLMESIEQVKERRHGVPFGIYTSGVISVDPEKLHVFDTIHVSLLAATPRDYCEAAGVFREEMFGDVCNFLVNAHEEGLPLQVGVLKKYAAEARELAIALGAQEVHLYD